MHVLLDAVSLQQTEMPLSSSSSLPPLTFADETFLTYYHTVLKMIHTQVLLQQPYMVPVGELWVKVSMVS